MLHFYYIFVKPFLIAIKIYILNTIPDTKTECGLLVSVYSDKALLKCGTTILKKSNMI